MERVFAIILAGGASARFWPLSGDETPKYLLKPGGGRTLVHMACERCLAVAARENIFVVTGEPQAALVQSALPHIPPQNFLVEPARRDTLAAVTLGVEAVARRDADALVVVTPADSLLDPSDCFAAPLTAAHQAGVFRSDMLLCFGVTPTRAEQGFGYVQRGREVFPGVHQALRFVEKPDSGTSQRFVKSGDYLWNCGSFAWSARAFLAEVERQHPETLAAVRTFLDLAPSARGERQRAYERATKVSVDYGVMEGAKNLGVLPLNARFDDIGTWDALAAQGQLSCARRIDVESSGCQAMSDGTVAFVGCQDLIVVQRDGKTLVMHKGSGQHVKLVQRQDDEP